MPETVHVELVAREIVGELSPGKTFAFWTFNGTVPGPMIRVMEGDLVEVTLHNEIMSAEPHNLDFHAVTGPGGGAPVTTVSPGESQTFTFRALHRGAYFYHCAAESMPWEHVAHGMFGLIQVEPPGGLPGGFREFYVGQSEWFLGDAADEDEEGEHERAGPQPDLTVDMEKAERGAPDLFSFNGHTEALWGEHLLGGAMSVRQGERVRIFFANAGPNGASSFHVIGGIFDRTYTADPADAVHGEETLLVPPGSAAVVELTAHVPGNYPMVDHALFHAKNGAMGMLKVTPLAASTPDDPRGSWPTDTYGPPAWDDRSHAPQLRSRRLVDPGP